MPKEEGEPAAALAGTSRCIGHAGTAPDISRNARTQADTLTEAREQNRSRARQQFADGLDPEVLGAIGFHKYPGPPLRVVGPDLIF
jgi:hypothetical protein